MGSFRNYSENFAILAKCENFAIGEILARLVKFHNRQASSNSDPIKDKQRTVLPFYIILFYFILYFLYFIKKMFVFLYIHILFLF